MVVVEDGPTVHTEECLSARERFCTDEACEIISPKSALVGSIKKAFEKYHQLEMVVPALGYSPEQVKELEKTLNACDCDYIVSGTPINLNSVVRVNKPIVQVNYALREKGALDLKKILKQKGFI